MVFRARKFLTDPRAENEASDRLIADLVMITKWFYVLAIEVHNFSFLLQTSQTHRTVYIKLIVTWKPSCFSLATNVAVTAFLAPYWMLIHTWSYQTSQWLLASGDQIKTNGSTVRYTHFTTWWSKHRSAMSLEEKGRKYLKEVWRTRPLDLNISCPTNGKEAMINTLRWEQLGALRAPWSKDI